MTSTPHTDVNEVLTKAPEDRTLAELEPLETWFRKRSKVFQTLPRETLLELMKQCYFRRVEKDVVIRQEADRNEDFVGAFYIILRGCVSVQLIPSLDPDDADVKVDESHHQHHTDRRGAVIKTLKDGDTFGELSLASDDCIQNAVYVADSQTDIIEIQKNVYKRCLADFIDPDFQDRMSFVDSNQLFNNWPNKWKKYLAASLVRQTLAFDEILVKQGEAADNMYFIISGEVCISLDAVAHNHQFADFMSKYAYLVEENEDVSQNMRYFSLANWLSAKSRVADRLKSALAGGSDVNEKSLSEDLPEFKVKLSPSAVRKKTARERQTAKKIKLCYLSKGNIVGDVEFILDMTLYHCTATCTQPTVAMSLHRAVYDRLIRKKNPTTHRQLCRSLERQIPVRFSRPTIVQAMPLIRYMVARIRELNGSGVRMGQSRDPRGHDVDTESLPFLDTSSSHAGSRSSRAKSGISARSFPMTRRSEERLLAANTANRPALPVVGQAGGSPRLVGSDVMSLADGDSTGQQTGAVDAASTGPTGETARSRDNPRDGIFIKLLQISNPMVKRSHLAVDEEEYKYLLQLRRRMAKTIEEFYPMATVALRATSLSRRPTTGRTGTLPLVPGISRSSPRKTALKRASAKGRPTTRQKNVFFSLP